MISVQPKVKHPYVSGQGVKLLTWVDIEDVSRPGYVYIRRFVVFRTDRCGLYIHWIYTPDGDRDPHNHKMNFWSWILRGSYTERRWWRRRRGGVAYCGSRERKRFSIAKTTLDDFHIIDSLNIDRTVGDPVITVLFCGRRSQDWGFLVPNVLGDFEFEHHRDYLAKRHLSV